MIVEYTHNILLTLGIHYSWAATQACTLRDFGLCQQDANDIRRYDEQRHRETWNVTPTAHVNKFRPRTVWIAASDDAIIAAVGREVWKSSRHIPWAEAIPTEDSK
jgi:hypothetical protein